MLPTPEIIAKYNRPGPRYTSYPTALEFSEDFSADAIVEDLRQQSGPLSLYFHLPFCQKLCWFCGCNTIINRDRDKATVYLDYLEKELELYDAIRSPQRPVVQLHFGGGTPNFLRPEQIDRLGGLIHKRFKFEAEAECSVELDPRQLTYEHVEAFRRMGVTRASFGVQDINEDTQKAINRIQPHELNVEAANNLRRAGFHSLNIDLVYGLPFQTVDKFKRTLNATLELDPDRFAIFNYAHVPWMKPAQKLLTRHTELPNAGLKLQLFKLIIETLTEAGYVYIGLDHFAKPTDELVLAQNNGTLQRNFQGYSTRAGAEIQAMGVSSIGMTARNYHQNVKELDPYYASLDAGKLPFFKSLTLTDEDQRRRTIIMRLMCDMALDYDRLSELLNLDFRERYAAEIKALDAFVQDGLLEQTGSGVVVTAPGRLLIRNIAMTFDEHTPKPGTSDKSNRFSRTI